MIEPETHLPPYQHRQRARGRRFALVVVVGLGLVAAACSSSKKTTTNTTTGSTATTVARGSGPVDVAYAGSLADAMTKQLGPGFNTATGYTFTGTSGDSGTLEQEILAGTMVSDIYISASPSKNTALEGSAGKNLVSWYATWSSSPLVL